MFLCMLRMFVRMLCTLVCILCKFVCMSMKVVLKAYGLTPFNNTQRCTAYVV